MDMHTSMNHLRMQQAIIALCIARETKFMITGNCPVCGMHLVKAPSVFFSINEASFISGTTLVADGGRLEIL